MTTYLVSVLLFSSFSLSLPLFVSAEVAGDLNGLYWEPLWEMTGLPLLPLPSPCLGLPVGGGGKIAPAESAHDALG